MATTFKSAKVISIDNFRTVACCNAAPISQAQLEQGARLYNEHLKGVEALQKFKLGVDQQLRAGAEIEQGALIFDQDLKIVRPRITARPRGFQVSIR